MQCWAARTFNFPSDAFVTIEAVKHSAVIETLVDQEAFERDSDQILKGKGFNC